MLLNIHPENTQFLFIEVRADEDIIRERLKHERPYSEADYNVYKMISDQNEPLREPHVILLSTNHNIKEMLTTAESHLKAKS